MTRVQAMAVLCCSALVALGCGAQAAEGVVAGSTNIAAAANGGIVVRVSDQAKDANGQIMTNWQSANAIDGLYVLGNHTPPDSYGWSTDTPPTAGSPHWIILGFGQEHKTHLISRVVIDPTTDDPAIIGRWVRNLEIQVSTTEIDGPYKTLGRYLVVNKPIKQAFDFPPAECRYLRILLLDNHGSDRCVELGEIEVYEAIIGEDQLGQLILRLENVLLDLKRYRDTLRYQAEKRTLEQVTRKDTAAPEPAPATP